MAIDYFILVPIVVIFAVIQSVFGMGLLVFGTPTLLLLGYDFFTTLCILLPASFVISFLQILSPKTKDVPISKNLYIYCLPAIGLGLWVKEFSLFDAWTGLMVGYVLVFSSLTRFWEPSKRLLKNITTSNSRLFHLLMGLIHGFTNLGGAMLSILANNSSSDKLVIRYTVAHYYIAFSAVQLITIGVIGDRIGLIIGNLGITAVTTGVYLVFGNRIFLKSSSIIFQRAFTVFIFLYGVLVIAKYT